MPRNLNLSLRRINNVSRTLRISVPHKFVDERGLREGDQVVWTQEGDTVRLTFVRLDKVAATTAPRAEAEATAEASAAA